MPEMNNFKVENDVYEVADKIARDNISAIENMTGAKNLLDTSPSQTGLVLGITWTLNADKTITATGTADNEYNSGIIITPNRNADNYSLNVYKGMILSGVSNGSSTTHYIAVSYSNDGVNWASEEHLFDGEITIKNYDYLNIVLVVYRGQTVTNLTFYPMIRPAGTDPTYAPYAMTNKQLTDDVAANTSAIGAITDVYGASNLFYETEFYDGGLNVTKNNDGSYSVMTGTTESTFQIGCVTNKLLKNTKYIFSVGVSDANVYIQVFYKATSSSEYETLVSIPNADSMEFTTPSSFYNVYVRISNYAGMQIPNVTFYPMLYDARLKPTGYVPYAMTNRELTERVKASGTFSSYGVFGSFYAGRPAIFFPVPFANEVNITLTSMTCFDGYTSEDVLSDFTTETTVDYSRNGIYLTTVSDNLGNLIGKFCKLDYTVT